MHLRALHALLPTSEGEGVARGPGLTQLLWRRCHPGSDVFSAVAEVFLTDLMMYAYIYIPNSRACVGFQSLGLGLARGNLQPSKSGMEPWNSGNLQPWNPGPGFSKLPRFQGSRNPEISKFHGSKVPRFQGSSVPGTLELRNFWNPATLERWSRGTLENL